LYCRGDFGGPAASHRAPLPLRYKERRHSCRRVSAVHLRGYSQQADKNVGAPQAQLNSWGCRMNPAFRWGYQEAPP
jgi:hypothetical protein